MLAEEDGDSLPTSTAISTPYYRFQILQIPKSKYFVPAWSMLYSLVDRVPSLAGVKSDELEALIAADPLRLMI